MLEAIGIPYFRSPLTRKTWNISIFESLDNFFISRSLALPPFSFRLSERVLPSSKSGARETSETGGNGEGSSDGGSNGLG